MRTHPTQNQPQTNHMYQHNDENRCNNFFSNSHPVRLPLNSPSCTRTRTRPQSIKEAHLDALNLPKRSR